MYAIDFALPTPDSLFLTVAYDVLADDENQSTSYALKIKKKNSDLALRLNHFL